jgi:hypothetical protein
MTSKSDRDNHANQLNPNNDAYWSSRGHGGGDDDDDYAPSRGSSWTSSTPFFPPRPAPATTQFTMSVILMDGRVDSYSLTVEASSAEDPKVVAAKAGSYMRNKAPRPFQHQLGVVELRNAQGELVSEVPRRLELYGYSSNSITQALLRRHLRTMDYRSQALAAQEAAAKAEEPAEREQLSRRHEVLMRASNHRAPTVSQWEPNPDAYTEYFRRSPAREQLPVLAAWFNTCLPALASYREAVRNGTAPAARSLGTLRIAY